MPIRITCPSCSATLSVKDEFAGRAVKCPKCGGVIPASAQPAAAPAAPAAPPAAAAPPPSVKAAPPKAAPVPPEPEKSPFEDLGESAKPKGGKITGKPTSRSKDEDDEDDKPRRKERDEDDRDKDEDKPRRKGRDERDEDEDKPRRKGRDEDDRDDDRGARSKRGAKDDQDEKGDRPTKRKRRDDDDDDDRPARGKKKGGGGAKIVLIICGTLLLICSGAGASVWFFIIKPLREAAENLNLRVNRPNYDRLVVGSTTRGGAEQILSGGKPATTEDVAQIIGTNDAAALDRWTAMVSKNRAVFWRNGDDFILAAFHPNADGSSRLMMKEWRPKIGISDFVGESLDSTFLQKYPATPADKKPGDPTGGGKDDEPPPGPLTEVAAEDLALAYKNNEESANSRYKDKWLVVEGTVLDVTSGPPDPNTNADTVMLKLVGVKLPTGGDFGVWCYVRVEESQKALDLGRGQTVKLKGKCTGGGTLQTYVGLKSCRIDFKGPDPALSTNALALVREFVTNTDAANDKYRDKEIKVTDAVFESLAGDLAIFTTTSKKGQPFKFQVRFTGTPIKKLEELKPNQRVTFRARCGGLFDKTIANYDGYIVP